uniref:Uncharacterized protein n=1 Tax=Oryza punctata TaxID=4537 RepID=A0A0E0KPC9_ORYPU
MSLYACSPSALITRINRACSLHSPPGLHSVNQRSHRLAVHARAHARFPSSRVASFLAARPPHLASPPHVFLVAQLAARPPRLASLLAARLPSFLALTFVSRSTLAMEPGAMKLAPYMEEALDS